MEMEYHDDSKRRKVFIVLGVVLAVVAGGAAFFLVNQAQSAGKRRSCRPDRWSWPRATCRCARSSRSLTWRSAPCPTIPA